MTGRGEGKQVYVEICSVKLKYDKQDQQGKAAFNVRSPHTIQVMRGKK
jgi:hypothetical protein